MWKFHDIITKELIKNKKVYTYFRVKFPFKQTTKRLKRLNCLPTRVWRFLAISFPTESQGGVILWINPVPRMPC